MDLLGLPKDGEELAQEPILKQGMVLKRGRKVTSQWKKRYFVLRPTTLSYHAGIDTEKEERRYIEITQNSTVIHRPDKHPLAFQVRTPGYRKITGRCENEEDLHLWMSAIEECIQRAPAWPIKCVVVGDDDEPTFGKRTLVSRYLEACRGKMEDGEAKMTNSHGYTLNKSRTRIVKTPDELGNVDIMLEYEKGEWVKVMLWHLDGREECTKLRALAYPHSDIYIVVFSVSVAKSFEKVESYLKEIKSTIRTTASQTAQAPLFLLVGTRLTSQLVEVGFNQAEEKARSLGFAGYVECRIESDEDCAQMFFDAVRLVVEKTVVVYAPNDPHNAEHARHSSGMFSSLAARLRKKNLGEGQEDGKTFHSTADTDSPDNSPSHRKKGFGFFASSDKVNGSALRTNSSKKSDMTSQSESVKSTATNNRPSAVEVDDDSDEGSLIGVEVDETEEEAKARHDRDFGLSSMKDDPQYTQRVLSRSNSRRSGEQSFVSHRSIGTHPDKELYDIHETPAEERERELEDLREKDAKKEREIERMKVMMDSLKTHNKAVEEQLKAMREELARVNLRGGPTLGVAPPTMPGLLLPPSSVSLPNPEKSAVSALPELPPRAPGPLDRSPASKASFRANRATSVFF